MNTTERSKVSKSINQEILIESQQEKFEMTLNTDSAIASGLLIQRLTELYENPIEATVRETVSNALDAVEEKCSEDVPKVEIIKPTRLNPIFIVKDNGVGMSVEDLKNIYSKYGASTKQNKLEQIGAYGLGAKAPLAYGTEFTVSSVKDGIKTSIIVVREETTNYIRIIESIQTDEPSGTTISIPVKSKDVDSFSSYVDLYKETPADYSSEMYIDGEIVSHENCLVAHDSLCLFEAPSEKVTGRLWIEDNGVMFSILMDFIMDLKKYKNEHNSNRAKQEIANFFRRRVQYVIGGWTYSVPDSAQKNHDEKVYIELKPGLVSFNSSRDSIIPNERYTSFEENLVEELILDENIQHMLNSLSTSNLDNFKIGTFSSLKPKYNLSGDMISTSPFPGFESTKHKGTSFKWSELIESAPPRKKAIPILFEKGGFYYNDKLETCLISTFSTLAGGFSGFMGVSSSNLKDARKESEKNFENLLEYNLRNSMAFVVSRKYMHPESKTKTLIVYDCKSQDIKKFYTKRQQMINSVFGESSIKNSRENEEFIFLVTEHTKEEVSLYLEALKENIDFISMGELTEKIKVNKKAEDKEKESHINTQLLMYDAEKNTFSRMKDINETPSNKKVVCVAFEDYPDKVQIKHISNWYSNKYNVDRNNLIVLSSIGLHRVVDFKILESIGDVFIQRNSPRISKTQYIEKYKNKIPKINFIYEKDNNLRERAISMLFTICLQLYRAVNLNFITSIKVNIPEEHNMEIDKLSIEVKKYLEVLKEYVDKDIMKSWKPVEYSDSSIEHLFSFIPEKEHKKLELILNLLSDGNGCRSKLIGNSIITLNFARESVFLSELDMNILNKNEKESLTYKLTEEKLKIILSQIKKM